MTVETAAGRYCSPNSRKSARSSRIHTGSSLNSSNKHRITGETAAGGIAVKTAGNPPNSSEIKSGSILNSCSRNRMTVEIAAGTYCSPNSRKPPNHPGPLRKQLLKDLRCNLTKQRGSSDADK
jgi:hypothetical protein